MEGDLRIVIAGGGTGGHLYPGVAVARELLNRHPSATVTFAGTVRGIESRVVPREGFVLDLIRSGGLKGKSIAGALKGAGLIPLGLLDAWKILSRRQPHLVIGVGGYSSGPVVLTAALRRVPTMLLEQNAVPGLTNRLLARFVQSAAVTYESTTAFFGSKAFVSGNPVRPEFIDGVAAVRNRENGHAAGARAVGVLVFGGSQGAHALNLAMVEAAPKLVDARVPIRLTHQTGERDVEMVRACYRAAGLDADVEAFLHDMGRRVGAADLVVSRSGATTLAELAAAGKPSLLVPLPTAADDHQRRNAEAFAAAGAAEVLLQPDASGGVLAGRILELAGDADRRAAMGAAARGLARVDAANAIVDRALALVRRG
jgi:UDP-N-acetylglucosamine--N-acetylmuramyl-(pentapeptide) pyrophosphoryl-undecaprenol N-acetylglucosamine transferase